MIKTWLKRLITVTAAAVLMMALAGCGGSGGSEEDKSLQKVLSAKQLVLGLDVNYPPMGYTDENGEIVGFDIDVAQEVCDRLGITLVKQPIDWDAKEEELNSGRIDCIWNGMSVSPEREEAMCISKPYLRNELVLVVASGSDIRSKQDIKGKKIGVQSGSTTQEVLEGSELSTENEVLTYDDNIGLMQGLRQGELDVTFIDSVNAYYYISMSDDRFFVLPESLGDEVFAVGFRKNDKALCEKVQETISEMRADGTLKNISAKWFGSDITIVK
ncbi:polar amino acid transport system substrate-binding protein [Ruminococcus sp. YE71]|uniref:amino acid ABC transporter substrate-binding protein n=1 Tax=unclassified Ruminococcus TaxID=2608920 RepID=UPI0008823E88|nr:MULTISPECIES: amino acid ABC transporter substrate-binding protein [unclassified Ruminococcus]SDA19800.1 polar amino acid transport system substrate-binding protein [Ruminococcus sp. YE78]SFW31405.1 polar amino acid transport system substrate-binding protein [Ruminococcus sp. YE71]